MILHVINVKCLGKFQVELSFNDGRTGIADLSESLYGPVFASLKDESLFGQVKVDKELDTISWPNGADFAPEYLYFQAFKDEQELREKFKDWGYIA